MAKRWPPLSSMECLFRVWGTFFVKHNAAVLTCTILISLNEFELFGIHMFWVSRWYPIWHYNFLRASYQHLFNLSSLPCSSFVASISSWHQEGGRSKKPRGIMMMIYDKTWASWWSIATIFWSYLLFVALIQAFLRSSWQWKSIKFNSDHFQFRGTNLIRQYDLLYQITILFVFSSFSPLPAVLLRGGNNLTFRVPLRYGRTDVMDFWRVTVSGLNGAILASEVAPAAATRVWDDGWPWSQHKGMDDFCCWISLGCFVASFSM